MSTEETIKTPLMNQDMQAPDTFIAQSSDKPHEGRTLTVALDMSQRSRDAFAWTVANLYRAGDKLNMVHVSPHPEAFVTGHVSMAPIHTLTEEDKRVAHQMLKNYAKYCLVNNITHEARHFMGDVGHVVGQLTTKQAGGSALIVGNHNKTSSEHFFLGSNSESAVHSAHIPVVVVKRPHKVSLDPDTKRRIGICVDSTEYARGAYDWMMNELFREGDSVFVLHMTSASAGTHRTVMNSIETLLDQYSHLLQERSADYHMVHSRTHKALPRAAAELANSLNLDCLVVGSRGRGAVSRTIFGSFSDGLVRACKCNIVVVKN